MTPLSCIEVFCAQNHLLKDAKLGYAGRLDPMAEGLLLVLVDKENLRRKEYEKLPKSYEFEVLFGISSDSYDVLGMPMLSKETISFDKLKKLLPDYLGDFLGELTQPYPPYSSPRVHGKPLFWWARAGKLDEITIPEKNIEIYSLELVNTSTITKSKLKKYIFEKIDTVKGDFRQEKIKMAWEKLFQNAPNEFLVASIIVNCSSGTYVRSLSYLLGKKLGTSSLALSIKRTKIGNFSEKNVEK